MSRDAASFEAVIRSYREKGTPTAVPEIDDVVWVAARIAAESRGSTWRWREPTPEPGMRSARTMRPHRGASEHCPPCPGHPTRHRPGATLVRLAR